MNTVEDIINNKIEYLRNQIERYEQWKEETNSVSTKALYDMYIEDSDYEIVLLTQIKPKISTLSAEDFWFLVHTFYEDINL